MKRKTIYKEVTRIIVFMKLGEEITTWDANEYYPRMTAQQIAYRLRHDERMEQSGVIQDSMHKVSKWRRIK